MASETATLPEGIHSLLDTDLYKLTMQSAVLKYFPTVEVEYNFTNRTPEMQLSRKAFSWLENQIQKLANISMTPDEIEYLRTTCPYLTPAYLHYMSSFRLRPSEQVKLEFEIDATHKGEDAKGTLHMRTKGLWLETILYEIPLLALTSEAYFKFCDRDWTYDGQVDTARDKGLRLLENGCVVSEFGSRRRRDYHTQDLVLQGLTAAIEEGKRRGYTGKISGTSNVHFARKFGIAPIGTVAHEWFMGIAAITDNAMGSSEIALRYWIGAFGKGVLSIALTDTFGTPAFLQAFRKRVPSVTAASSGAAMTSSAAFAADAQPPAERFASTEPPLDASSNGQPVSVPAKPHETYAKVFNGVRQDSGDPVEFIARMRKFYDSEGIRDKKTIVFSDSLNTDRCIEYREKALEAGFAPSFGVGTFFTNDYVVASNPSKKSSPMNIVIKLSSAAGRPAVKISDNIGKNTGDSAVVAEIKRQLGYEEHNWANGDESTRWSGR